MSLDQSWFEILDLRQRKLDLSVWIPLRSEKSIENSEKRNFGGYEEEFLGAGSLMLPRSRKVDSKKLNWMDIGISRFHDSSVRDGIYYTADTYKSEDVEGVNLVINQSFDNNFDTNEWHLHQDLVVSLRLKREGDVWVCPREGYIDVAKLERDKGGRPILLQIKSQFLKEYLRDRDSGLYVSSYISRTAIVEDASFLSWAKGGVREKKDKDVWETHISEIHEGGSGLPFGQPISVSHVGRIDIFENEDVPDISRFPNEDGVVSKFYERHFTGRKLFRIMSELWKYDWINPGRSVSKLHDVYFLYDAEGRKQSGRKLRKGGKWLWFRPELVGALLSKRGSFLRWYSQDTGSLSCAPDGGIHFGVNELGLITIYAKDVGYLPTWQQQIWAGFNVAPEGGISKELHASQVKAEPANTLAPEDFIGSVVREINEASLSRLGVAFFREHDSIKEILSNIHRFRAINQNGLFSLAKDLARVIADDINTENLQKIATPPKGMKWGSIKTVENLLAIKVGTENARKVLAPIVGIYELRHGDAHLPSGDIKDSFVLIGLDRDAPYIIQGVRMLITCVDHLHHILYILKNWDRIDGVS